MIGQDHRRVLPETIGRLPLQRVLVVETLESIFIQDLQLKNVKKHHQLVPEKIQRDEESLMRMKEALEVITILIVQDLQLKNRKKLHRLVPETMGHHHQESLVKRRETSEDTTIQIVPIPGLQNLTKSFQWISISTNL